MAQVTSAARCWVGAGLFFIVLGLGTGICTHFLATWFTFGATFDGVSASIEIGLWKVCGVAQDGSAQASQCVDDANLPTTLSTPPIDYVRGLDIAGLCASFLALMFALCGFTSTGSQIASGVLSLLGGGGMLGAVGRFVLAVNDFVGSGIISSGYSTAFYLACASGGAAMIAGVLILIASCMSCGTEKETDEIRLVHVVMQP